MIIGLGCSGKSTLARRVGAVTGLPVHHLDQHLWQPGWIRTERKEFLKEQLRLLNGPQWVYEGFNPQTFQVQIAAADSIVYIKTNHLKQTYNWFKRLYKYRYTSRPDMAYGNIEKFNMFYLKWLWRYDSNEILNQVKSLSGNKKLTVLGNIKQINRFLQTLQNQLSTK